MIVRTRLRDLQSQSEETNYWMSYSDVMAALLLMFVLLLILLVTDYRLQLINQQQQLQTVQRRLQEQVGVRKQIISDLVSAFQSRDLQIDMDNRTGVIRMPGSILFGYNETMLAPEGKAYLDKFFPAYATILLSPKYREYLDSIIIEGHTDASGTYMYNLDLSQRRAFSVASYILSGNLPAFPNESLLRMYLTAEGRSFSDPILNEDGTVNAAKSRRVEFKFRLKDDVLLEQMRDILSRDVGE